ncbi:DUF4389 domain-containing protein [Nocardia sp. NPDC051030]|uniref:DUF4389 domain-containing protein n=1 Tax=Nocardia sp. NPDC051030 TaxID=3155162 RepID=UPI003415E2EF
MVFPPDIPVTNATVDLDVFPPQQHRRWTVLLRALLVIPHLIVLWLLSIAATVVVICGWFGALAMGRLPQWCGDFLRNFFAYAARVHGYSMMLVDDYPPFSLSTEAEYPVRMLFPAPTPLNRVAVLFRLILALPILVLTGWLSSGWAIVSFFIWLITVITGRMPQSAFEASAAVLRAEMRTGAYVYLLTPTYLSGIFGDPTLLPVVDPALPEMHPAQVEPARFSATRPLWMSRGGQILLIVMLVLGVISSFFRVSAGDEDDDRTDTGAVSSSHLESQVGTDYTDRTGRTASEVSCPHDLQPRYGASVTCTVHDNGAMIPAAVTVDEMTDSELHYNISLGSQ